MKALSEQRSLNINPLPEEEIKDPLTMIWTLDGDILKLQDQIKTIQEEKAKYLSYAIKHGINEDSDCKLEVVTKEPKQTVNVDILKTYKKAYARIWERKKQEAQDAVNLFGDKPEECKAVFEVSQPEAKKTLKADGVVLDVVLHRVGETKTEYKVTKKPMKE